MNPLAPALIGASGAMAVAVIGAWLAYLRYLNERKDAQETLLNCLFAELTNIHEHYFYAANELPVDPANVRELRKRLLISKYGSLRTMDDVTSYGFLRAKEIHLLFQLSLRVRNNDQILDLMLEDLAGVTTHELASLVPRMNYAIQTSQQILDHLVEQRPHLRDLGG